MNRKKLRLLLLIPLVLFVLGVSSGVVFQKAYLCPRCFSTEVARIEYGYAPTGIGSGNHKTIAGGCIVSLSSPTRQCLTCKKEFAPLLITFLGSVSIVFAVIATVLVSFASFFKSRKRTLIN